MKELTCMRCGHHWYPRQKSLPKKCPHCTSVVWSKSRGSKEIKDGCACSEHFPHSYSKVYKSYFCSLCDLWTVESEGGNGKPERPSEVGLCSPKKG